MRVLLLMLLLALPAAAQKEDSATTQAKALREEYIAATKTLLESYDTLAISREREYQRAQSRLYQSQEMHAEGNVSISEVEKNKQSVAVAKEKLDDLRARIATAESNLNSLPSVSELAADLRKEARRNKRRSCSRWTLNAYQRETRTATVTGFRFVCQR